MSLRQLISLLAASLVASLMLSLLATQPAFAKGKKAYFPGGCKTSCPTWAIDHCELNASAAVKVKGKGNFTLFLRTNMDDELTLVHQQPISGPMDFWVHLYGVPVGYDGDSVTLEWTILDKRGRIKDFLIMGPYDCDAP